MKVNILSVILLSIVATLPARAEYKPLLEKGKSWTCYYRGMNNTTDNPALRGIGITAFSRLFTAYVAGDTVVNGKQCWRIVRDMHNDAVEQSAEEYLLHEDGETVSLVKPYYGVTRLIPMMRFDVSVGDSLGLCDEYGDPILYPGFGDISDYYRYIVACDTVVGSDGVERREISIGSSSWVEGVGFSRGYNFMIESSSGMESYSEMSFKTLDCSVNGESIFKKKDFKLQFEGDIVYESIFTPGKSWTMARGNEVFTVIVDCDTIIDGIAAKRLIDSNGKTYVVIEDKTKVYSFFDHYGRIAPLYNAVPLMRCDLDENTMFYRYIFGEDPDWDWEKNKQTNRNNCFVRSINTLTVKGLEYKEWVLENEDGEVVASWVEGIGAPDAQSWLMEMPADYDLRMIDCRQDGEVIFTAEDFTHQSGIREVSADGTNRAGAYDLQGRRVDHPTRGLYIINGKKTLLK